MKRGSRRPSVRSTFRETSSKRRPFWPNSGDPGSSSRPIAATLARDVFFLEWVELAMFMDVRRGVEVLRGEVWEEIDSRLLLYMGG